MKKHTYVLMIGLVALVTLIGGCSASSTTSMSSVGSKSAVAAQQALQQVNPSSTQQTLTKKTTISLFNVNQWANAVGKLSAVQNATKVARENVEFRKMLESTFNRINTTQKTTN